MMNIKLLKIKLMQKFNFLYLDILKRNKNKTLTKESKKIDGENITPIKYSKAIKT